MNSTKALFNKQAAQKSPERQQLLQRPAYESNVPYITRAFVKEIDLEGGRFNKFNPINSIKADVPQLPKYPMKIVIILAIRFFIRCFRHT